MATINLRSNINHLKTKFRDMKGIKFGKNVNKTVQAEDICTNPKQEK